MPVFHATTVPSQRIWLIRHVSFWIDSNYLSDTGSAHLTVRLFSVFLFLLLESSQEHCVAPGTFIKRFQCRIVSVCAWIPSSMSSEDCTINIS